MTEARRPIDAAGACRRPRAAAIFPPLLALALVACAGEGTSPERSSAFLCPDGTVLLATFYPEDDRMRLRVNDRDYDLPRLISASGARYGDEHTIFWNKGREAILERPDGPSYVGCLAAS